MGKTLEFGEDSRLKGYSDRVTHAVLPLARTYCANCGRPWGWVSEESSEYIATAEIVVFCEECFATLNPAQLASPCRRIPESDLSRLGLVEQRPL